MINTNFETDVAIEYGNLYELNEKTNRISFFNEQGFAKFYQLNHQLVFVDEKKSFYNYDPTTGLWQVMGKEALANSISLFIKEYADLEGIEVLNCNRKLGVIRSIQSYLPHMCAQSNFFKRSDNVFIHCKNGVLELVNNRWELKPFSPDYHSRNRCEIEYNPQIVAATNFQESLKNLVPEQDMEMLQCYIGQCLIGVNLTQSILLLTGSGGSGKGTLANIIEMLIGDGNTVNIRPENITGRFETSFFMDKTLLTGKESSTDFFSSKGMSILKALVGDDKLRVEHKGSNKNLQIDGIFNIFIVGNSIPKLAFESNDDISAWRRRIRWIKCKTYRPEFPIPNYAKKLIDSEGSAILNWALAGACKIISSNSSRLPCNDYQSGMIELLINHSNSVEYFLKSSVEPTRGVSITVEELYKTYIMFCQHYELTQVSSREFQRSSEQLMLELFQATKRTDVKRSSSSGKQTNHRGYYHVQFKQRS